MVVADKTREIMSEGLEGAFSPEEVVRRDPQVVWVITEADRSATTVLLPEDY